jgi:CubicO group peptidase (beta-lactamase class C family)
MRALTYTNPPGFSGVGLVNTARWRSLVHPSTALHADAAGIAGAYALLLGRRALLAREIRERATEECANGDDLVLGSPVRFGRGFQLPTDTRRFGPHDAAFGHWGAGGSLGFCDPEAGLAFGYAMNRMGSGWQNERNRALVDALYGCL